jgi:hypothetical protein
MPDIKIIVLGGTGFLGRRVIESLKRATGVQISVAGRKGPLVVDLNDTRTFPLLHGADIAIDLASSPEAMPEALAIYCVKQGITLIETSADRAVLEELPRHLANTTGPGRVILGAGLFPGLSNLVARAAAETSSKALSLKLGISSNVFSGAGRATIALMAHAMSDEAISFRAGEPNFHPRMVEGESLQFPTGPQATVIAPVADAAMVRASTGVPNIAVFLSPRPAWIQSLLLAVPGPLRTSARFRHFVFWSLLLMRRYLFAEAASPVELVAIARDEAGKTRRVTLSTMDGMGAAGAAIAAIAMISRERRASLQAVSYVDQVMTLTEATTRLNRLVPPGAEVRIDGV